MYLAKHLKIIDIPASAPHKTHAHPTPLAGGLLMVHHHMVTLIFRQWLNREIMIVLIALIIFIFGFVG
jgi:UDP-N-acetylmuramyl pentapeptide phosphotransferase/UDP-N-acetylglucosamine-1-phosphate transferase